MRFYIINLWGYRMKIEFMPIDYDYFDFQGRNYVRIVGRTSDGKRALIVDSCDVYFWVVMKANVSEKKIEKVAEKIDGIVVKGKVRDGKVLRTEVLDKKFLGESVRAVKVYVSNFKDAHDIASEIDFSEVEKRREYDIGFVSRYIREKKVRPMNWYVVEGESLSGSVEFGGIGEIDVDICLKVEEIEGVDRKGVKGDKKDNGEGDKGYEYEPKILAYDIETDGFEIGKDEIVMISLVGRDFKKVLTWKKDKVEGKGEGKGGGKKDSKKDDGLGFVENYKDEGEMIEGFLSEVKKYDPDFLVGYFSDGFDLPYLRARAEVNGVKLDLGVDGSVPSFSRGRVLTGKIRGIVHLDLFRFIRVAYSQYLQSESLSLDDVAGELLGKKKDGWKHKHSSKISSSEWVRYFGYNLKDSEITYELALKVWADLLEFSRVIGEPLFNVSRDSMSAQIENYIIHHIDEYGEIVEKRPYEKEIGRRRSEEKYEGAFVYEPKPGLYEDVVFFDFTSMYGSVIVSYNLSKSSFREKKEKNSVGVEIDSGSGEKVYFSKKVGFFSEMIKEMIEKRKEVKKEYSKDSSPLLKARSNAFKLLVNAAYGYQGFFGARYYCREAAAATAAFARKEIHKAISDIKKKGYEVVYSDTDSIAFLQGNRNKKDVSGLLEEINSGLPGIMELDLEGFFKRGIWVAKRSGKEGAKKKYALLDERDGMKIRGFETVRRDWCLLAREVQNKVLEMVLKDGDEKKALVYVKGVIKKLKKRDVDMDKLVIKTQLKRAVEDYKALGPHVVIAKRMIEKGMKVNVGMLIEYYIAEGVNGKRSLVRDRARMVDEMKKGNYDIEYYLNSQILPAVENIFEVFGVSGRGLVDGEVQKGLGEF